MGEYLRPDVYIEERSNSAGAIEAVGTATAGFIGISPRGDASKAIFITSWNDFCLNFARGVTPFRTDSDLAYAVKGFFENGGGRAWIKRVVGSAAAKATCKVPAVTGADIEMVDYGEFANGKVKVTVAANTDGEAGTKQVETATVVGTVTTAGNATITVTCAGMTGSPKAVSVAVALDDTASAVATKIRAALNADATISAWFLIGGSGEDIILTRKSEAANDTTINVAIANDTCAGLTDAATSANTTAGVAPTVTYNVRVDYDGVQQEYFEVVSNSPTSDNYYGKVINDISKWIYIAPGETLAVGNNTMTNGAGDEAALIDSDFTAALTAFDVIEDINLIAIPGKTATTVITGLLDYTAGRKDCFALPDVPPGEIPSEVVALRANWSGTYGAIYYPWIKVDDPLSKQGKLRLCPPSGHMMGIYARTDRDRGVHKAPAGVEAIVRGAKDVERRLSNGDIELLNPLGINCIVTKRNIGIVVWGARTLSTNAEKRYVTDVRLDMNIEVSCYRGTQWTVFEPNDENMWSKLSNQIKAFLYTKWREGALFGEKPEDAYYVKCDAELNPEEIRNAGRVICEIGYAKKKPAEFVILVFTQKTASTSA